VSYAGDQALASQCARGDRSAQQRLFDNYLSYVHAILYRILGSNSEVEDVCQEAFLQIFRSLPNYRGEASLKTWIARITVRTAHAFLSKKRPTSVHLEAIPEVGHDPTTIQKLAIRQAGRRLYCLLDEMDAKYRIPFVLHVIEGFPMKEVAAMTESTVVATKSRVLRARKRVRKDPTVAALLKGDSVEADS
jgi:RNA polymerase sigma-70 factor (ECF subfamily)